MKYYFTIIRKELMEVFRDKNSFFMSLILVLIMPTIIIEYGIQFGTQDGKILITERAKEIAFIIEQVDVPYEIIEVQDLSLIHISSHSRSFCDIPSHKEDCPTADRWQKRHPAEPLQLPWAHSPQKAGTAPDRCV